MNRSCVHSPEAAAPPTRYKYQEWKARVAIKSRDVPSAADLRRGGPASMASGSDPWLVIWVVLVVLFVIDRKSVV